MTWDGLEKPSCSGLQRELSPIGAIVWATAEPGVAGGGVVDHHVDRGADADGVFLVRKALAEPCPVYFSLPLGQMVVHFLAAGMKFDLCSCRSAAHLAAAVEMRASRPE